MVDSRLQEIVVRAVVGRAERRLAWSHKIVTSDVSQVLGVRLGKAAVAVDMEDDRPHADLTVDCDLWCSSGTETGEETKVLRTRCRAIQEVAVPLRGEVLGDVQNLVELVSGPRSTGVAVEEDGVAIDFEAIVQVEVIAFTRLWVKSYEMDFSGLSLDDDDWDGSLTGESSSPYGSH